MYFVFAFLIFAPLLLAWKSYRCSAVLRRVGVKDRAWVAISILFLATSILSVIVTFDYVFGHTP